MVVRIWHGTTTRENAAAYEQLVTTKIFREIKAKTGEGFKGVQLLKREMTKEVEFTTMIWFRDMETIKKLVGEDYETAYVPEEARKLLLRYDPSVTHSRLIYSSES